MQAKEDEIEEIDLDDVDEVAKKNTGSPKAKPISPKAHLAQMKEAR